MTTMQKCNILYNKLPCKDYRTSKELSNILTNLGIRNALVYNGIIFDYLTLVGIDYATWPLLLQAAFSNVIVDHIRGYEYIIALYLEYQQEQTET